MKNPHHTFLKCFSWLFFPVITGIAFVNLVVDPLAFFNTPRIAQFNAVKTEGNNKVRLFKAQDLLRERPTSVIFGSSRVMAGFDPQDIKNVTQGTAYNAGIVAANFAEIYEYFLHALYCQPKLETVIIGLDAFCFNAYEKVKDDMPKFLHGSRSMWKERLDALFSYSALEASWSTVKLNYSGAAAQGFLRSGFFNPRYAGDIEANPLIKDGEVAFVRKLHHEGMYKQFRIDYESLDKFQDLVRICKEKCIKLKVFINPVQAVYWEGLYQHGYWEILAELKRNLAVIYPVWDFSGFNLVTVQCRAPGENVLYYETSHFQPILGKVILDILFEQNESPIQFGRLLSAENIEECLRLDREEREFWAVAHPQLVEQLKNEIWFTAL